jgi:hypothetical protein
MRFLACLNTGCLCIDSTDLSFCWVAYNFFNPLADMFKATSVDLTREEQEAIQQSIEMRERTARTTHLLQIQEWEGQRPMMQSTRAPGEFWWAVYMQQVILRALHTGTQWIGDELQAKWHALAGALKFNPVPRVLSWSSLTYSMISVEMFLGSTNLQSPEYVEETIPQDADRNGTIHLLRPTRI